MRILILLGFCLMTSLGFGQSNYSTEVEEQIKKVENNLAGRVKIEGKETYNILDRMALYNVKGLSIAVVKDYKVVWAKGYGWADEKEKRPVTTETLFEPGSISKSLNAVGILKLVQDKKLDLFVDINTYLKSWKFPYDSISKGKKITLANLLSHTAGLTVHGFPGYDRKSQIPTLPQILNGQPPANTSAVRSENEPGLESKYSGGGTIISQLIVNDVTHLPYDQFMYDNVLKPMGMIHSSYSQPPNPDKFKYLATGYRSDGSEIENKFHVYPEQAAAGLWMTPTDLCNYIIETQLAYEGKSSKVLNQEMTKLRLTPYIDKSAALGVFIEERGGKKYFQHGAGNEGFRGFYYGTLEGGNGVAVFVNSDNAQILFELMNSIATVYNWKGFYEPVSKKVVDVPESQLQKYVGIYTVINESFTSIVKKQDGYYLFADGDYSKMYFTSKTDFFNMEFSTDKHFLTDSLGNVTGYLRSANGTQLPGATKILNPQILKGNEEFFNSIGWNLLENKNYDEAIKYLRRGLELHPTSLLIEGNLAHCYLFKKDYQTALRIYKSHLEERVNAQFTWIDMIKQDFVFFKNNKFDKELMDKAFADLKLVAPKEY